MNKYPTPHCFCCAFSPFSQIKERNELWFQVRLWVVSQVVTRLLFVLLLFFILILTEKKRVGFKKLIRNSSVLFKLFLTREQHSNVVNLRELEKVNVKSVKWFRDQIRMNHFSLRLLLHLRRRRRCRCCRSLEWNAKQQKCMYQMRAEHNILRDFGPVKATGYKRDEVHVWISFVLDIWITDKRTCERMKLKMWGMRLKLFSRFAHGYGLPALPVRREFMYDWRYKMRLQFLIYFHNNLLTSKLETRDKIFLIMRWTCFKFLFFINILPTIVTYVHLTLLTLMNHA